MIIETIKQLRKKAMLEKNSLDKRVYTNLLGEIDRLKGTKLEIKTDEQVFAIINKIMTTNQVNIEFLDGKSLIPLELKSENELLGKLLPKMQSAEATQEIVRGAIEFTGATTMKEMGKVIGSIKKAHGATLSYAYVAELVKEHLNKPNK